MSTVYSGEISQAQYAAWRAVVAITTPNPQVASGPWRPPAWAQNYPGTFVADEDGVLWFFDAVMRNEHLASQRITQHPVQDRASIADHSFSLPEQLTLEIGMSDSMDSYEPGQWGDGDVFPSRSVNAYTKLIEWKDSGMPLSISTRLREYVNMVIEYISAPDTNETKFGLRCSVSFRQLFVAKVSARTTNLRPHVLDETNKGSQSVTSVENAPDFLSHIVNGWNFLTGGL